MDSRAARLNIPLADFDRVLASLRNGHRATKLQLPLGWCRDGSRLEAIVRPLPVEPAAAALGRSGGIGGIAGRPGPSLTASLCAERFGPAPPPERFGPQGGCLLEIGDGPLRGQASGWLLDPGSSTRPLPLARLDLPGRGFLSIRLTGPGSAEERLDRETRNRFSRTIGGLGSETAYARLRGIRAGFVGLGRLGTDILFRLVQNGYLAEVVLIDPDKIELHNTGESPIFDPGTVGLPKVVAAEHWLLLHHPRIEARAIRRPASHREAIEALKTCDVIFSCADHPGARLVAGLVAAAYRRVLIDAGTYVGVGATTETTGTSVGSDVRLVLPDDRCILCYGGVSGETAGREALRSPDRERAELAAADWRNQRGGSLASLNDRASCDARRLLERLVVGQLGDSVWLQYDEPGEPPAPAPVVPGPVAPGLETVPAPFRLALPRPRRSPRTPCFCRLAGEGDAAIGQAGEILRERA